MRNELCFNKLLIFEEYNGCLLRLLGIVKDLKINFKLYFNIFCVCCVGVVYVNIVCGLIKILVFGFFIFCNYFSIFILMLLMDLVFIGIFFNLEEV